MVSGCPLVLGHGGDWGFEGDGGEIRCGNHKKKVTRSGCKKTRVLLLLLKKKNRSAGKAEIEKTEEVCRGKHKQTKVEVEGGNAPTKCRHVLPPSRFEENQ